MQMQTREHPFLAAYIRFADSLSIAVARLMAVFVVFLILLIVHEVALRYIFNAPTIWGLEVQSIIFGTLCMLAIPYATYKGCHPRVTVFLDTCPPRARLYLEIVYIIIFLFPFMVVLLWFESREVYAAWRIGETSTLGAWEPPLWPIKASIPLGAGLVLFQGFAELAKALFKVQLQHTACYKRST